MHGTCIKIKQVPAMLKNQHTDDFIIMTYEMSEEQWGGLSCSTLC